MANKSDYKQNRTRVDQYLPEVNKSEINKTLFEGAHNRHLTKDNTIHLNGYIGERNPASIASRRLIETDPHVDAFQLEPVMFTTIGVENQVLTQQSFLTQLELLGVNTDELPVWGNTTKFNWVPPINLDMLVNYFNYFWQTDNLSDPPQYFTIESACNKAQSRVDSYTTVLTQRGNTLPVFSVNPVTNTFTFDSEVTDIFNAGYKFKTINTLVRNFTNIKWTAVSSTSENNITTVVVQEPIAIISTTQPPPTRVGRWWYNPTTLELSAFNGTVWLPTSSVVIMDADLNHQLDLYQAGADCACNQQAGWDSAPWDDNQLGSVEWSDAFLDQISFLTELEWISVNGPPVFNSIWYNLTTDDLLVRDDTDSWKTITTFFSSIVDQLTGTQAWDYTIGCVAQPDNPWYAQNRWIHKSQIQSSVGIKRASGPIIEYDSRAELNNWVQYDYAWKYRRDVSLPFTDSDVGPSRLELDPVKGFTAVRTPDAWLFYLYDTEQQQSKNIDYTSIFVPGYSFRVTDDSNISYVCTVTHSTHRQSIPTDPATVYDESYVTVVQIDQLDYLGPELGGTAAHIRIEPLQTAQGDNWRGYQVHWVLDTSNTRQLPTAPKVLRNPVPSVLPTVVSLPIGETYVEPWYQETTLAASTSTFDLLPSLTYDPLNESNAYAVAGYQQLRVYVNGVRQYGNYVETTDTVEYDYVMVGVMSYAADDSLSPEVTYVTGIVFDTPIPQFSVVRIEIGCPAESDVGLSLLPIRTIENEDAFLEQLSTQQQPVMMSLIDYELKEQQKSAVNQYPLFNVYDIVTGDVVKASSLFAYQELETNPINSFTQRRITTLDDGRDYVFEQTLLDGSLTRAYRLTTATPFMWYSPLTEETLYWNGAAYSSLYRSTDSVGTEYVSEIVTSTTEPDYLNDVPQALWFNPNTLTLTSRNIILEQWVPVVIPTVRTNTADPLLQTVWKQGLNSEEYTPAYVDRLAEPIAIGDEDGSWETLSQWYFNSEHDNKQQVSYAQLVSHFNDILSSQPPIPALQSGGVYGYTQQQLNAGLGGLIREHNNSFDLLISAINNTDTSPITVLEFAKTQYQNALLSIEQYVATSLSTVMKQATPATLDDLYTLVTEDAITQYENNDFTFRLFGDSSSYVESTDTGIRSWISTMPMFGYINPTPPILLTDGSKTELIHHDGHRSEIRYSSTQTDRIIEPLLSLIGADGTPQTVTSTQLPPAAYDDIVAAFPSSGTLIGKLWYTTTFGTRNLYQLQGVAILASEPSISINTPDGTKYYNINDEQVYEVQGAAWVATSDPVGTLYSMWTVVDIEVVVANALLEVENRLYSVSLDVPAKPVMYETLPEQETSYTNLYYERFVSYVNDNAMRTPLANTSFNLVDPFTWNYMFSVISTPPTAETQPLAYSSYQALYNGWYNTPTPHLEPWKLQGYTSKPDWWDEEYLNDDINVYGNRRWKYIHATQTGMWANILQGIIPIGRTAPLVTVPTYTYVPVNIDDVDTSLVGGYAPDDLLPPYFNVSTSLAAPDVRSLFTSYDLEILSPESDYSFGYLGPVEWAWLTSIAYQYDLLVINFLLQPAKFLHYAFGPDYTTVDGLRYDIETHTVYSHEDILFHGDAKDDVSNVNVRGMNQWYVNQNRYAGRDTGATFTTTWKDWNPLLGYQTNGIMDTSTFNVTNKYFDITTQDYNVVLAKDGVIDDIWIDAFRLDVLSIPPSIIQYNNQANWKIALSSLAPTNRQIQTYGTKKYPFTFAVNGTVASIYEYETVQVSSVGNWVTVRYDQTNVFELGDVVQFSDSGLNDGEYTIRSVTYDAALELTKMHFVESITDNELGTITADHPALDWDTGTQVVLTTTRKLPSPLLEGTPYYIIAVDDNQFSLAETFDAAMLGTAIDFATAGQGIFYVGQVDSTFQVYGGAGVSKEQWIHYTIDKRVVNTLLPPKTITGIQTLIDVIDGYEAYQRDHGVLYGTGEYSEYDPNTGRLIAWQSEMERFIDWAFSIRRSSVRLSDRYEITVSNLSTDEFTFGSDVPGWKIGTPVVLTTTGSLPTGTATSVEYFYVPTGTSTFKLSAYLTNDPLAVVDIQSVGSGTIFVSMMTNQQMYPSFELNPTRNQIVVQTPVGVLANVLQGAQSDVRISQTLFDQYSRPLTADKIIVYRSDLESRIRVLEALPNDVELQIRGLEDPYNYLHLGGAHLFVHKYQHIVLFNPTTISSSYIYDPFVGLNVKRFDVDFYETENYTLRPNIGGHYLIGSDFKRNIEGSISDIQTYYSAYDQVTQTDTAKYSKLLLDYKGSLSFLDALNLNQASQFAFYRGMIQRKGSLESVDAYINSRRFVDAKIDEYWAWKLADFGDVRPKYYPEIKISADDGVLDDIQLVFAASNAEVESDITQELIDSGFEVIPPNSTTRYYKQPDQNNSLFLEVDVVDSVRVYVSEEAPISIFDTKKENLLWVNPNPVELDGDFPISVFNGTTWVQYEGTEAWVVGTTIRLQLSVPVDAVRIITQRPRVANVIDDYETSVLTESEAIYQRLNAEIVSIEMDSLPVTTDVYDVLLNVYGLGVSVAKNNTARLIDTKTQTTTSNLPLWDPARGIHYHTAIHNVDLLVSDPAKYSTSLVTVDTNRPWTYPEVGTVWVDSSQMSYIPYYDDKIFTNVRDRIRNWGKQSEWASINAYEWVESTTPPERWSDLVNASTTLPNGSVASGTAKISSFTKVRDTITGVDVVDLTSSTLVYTTVLGAGAAETTGLVPGSTYTFTIMVGAQSYLVSALGSQIATYGDLATYIETSIGVDVVQVDVTTTTFTITSTLYGPLAMSVSSDTLFTSIPDFTQPAVYTAGSYSSTLRVYDELFAVDDYIIITSPSTDDLEANVEYIVTAVDSVFIGPAFQYQDLTIVTSISEPVAIENEYADLTAVKGFQTIPWTKDVLVSQRLLAGMEYVAAGTITSIDLDSTKGWLPGDLVDVYVNGLIVTEATPIDELYAITVDFAVALSDVIEVVRPLHVVTAEEIGQSSSADDGTALVWWIESYEYGTSTRMVSNTPTTYYYFWVEDSLSRNAAKRNELSVLDIARGLEDIPTPYIVQQNPLDDPAFSFTLEYGYGESEYGKIFSIPDLAEQFITIPVYYRGVILRNMSSFIQDDDRYIVQFTRDLTLRYQPDTINGFMDLKNKHQEWLLIRNKQLNTIDRRLWDRVTESMIGYKLTDSTILVPSLDRQLYDDMFLTDTQYGLADGQAFINRDLAISTVRAFLLNPLVDFYPINVDAFLATYDFSTPENIRAGMDEIYNTFGTETVNDLWFELLSDAFSTKKQHKELMKTSWIALHGIRILDVNGLFDD